MRKLLTLLLCQLLVMQFSFAQGRVITGKVTDADGAPVPNATILIKGTKTGTTSQQDGSYSISVPANARTLVISSIGMNPVELEIANRTDFNARLTTTEKVLEETVVVGYTVQKRKEVASAIAKISAQEIDNLPIPTFAQAMQGRAAGVAISANNGIPGGSLNVRIRGFGSLNAGNEPLYVVDGVQMNTANGSSVTQSNPLAFLNTNDVESIEILKDAAAAAIYGARAANGVVLITTKKGGSTGRTRWNAHVSTGLASPMRLLEPMTTQDWIQARVEAIVNSSTAATLATPATALVTALTDIGRPTNLTPEQVAALPTYDWQKETWGTGAIKTAEMSLQAGNQTTSLYMSGSYSKQEAIIHPADFERGTFLIKGSHKANKNLLVESNVNLSSFKQMASLTVDGNFVNNPAYAAIQMIPINPIKNPDGSWFGLVGSGQTIFGFTNGTNPGASQDLATRWTTTNQMVGSLAATYTLAKNWTLRGTAGLDYRMNENYSYGDPRNNTNAATMGSLTQGVNQNKNFLTNVVSNYRKVIANKHTLTAMVGAEYRSDIATGISANGINFPSHEFRYLSTAATPNSVSGSWTGSRTVSQFGRFGYNYLSKYIVGFTLRRDGSSRFGGEDKYGVFPSVQVAWNAKDENFFKQLNNISELKFRYSYGQTGNDQIGNFESRWLYGASRVYNGLGAINPTQLGNDAISWETREESNFGFDFGMFKNRVSLNVDIYDRRNKNLLLDRSLYTSTGFTNLTQNVGTMQNKGFEAMLRFVPFDGEFRWTSSFNYTTYKNTILKLYDGLQVLPGDPSVRVGEASNSHFAAQFAGINPANGRSMFYDVNGNITYTPTVADRKILGNVQPKHFGGWNNNLSWKGFEIDAFFQYDYGRIRNDQQMTLTSRVGNNATSSTKNFYDNRWTTPGQVTFFPRPVVGQADINMGSWVNTSTTNQWMYKNDYIRLKQFTLSYVLPAKVLQNAKMSSVKFYVQGINLWTYTEFPGYDPEYTGGGSGIIPQAKNITAGVQLGF